MSNYKALLKHITTFIFDYDGVLTNGTVRSEERRVGKVCKSRWSR